MEIPFAIQAIVFIFGTCIGSFLNVCIYRVPLGKSIIYPGSACPGCGHVIRFYENIPIISYLALRGRCSGCKVPISLRYPAVELITGAAALFTTLKFGIGLESLFIFTFLSTLLAVSAIDIDHQIIPDTISLPGIVIFATAPFFIPEMTIKDTLMGIISGGGSLYMVAFLYLLLRKEEGMGGGDIKLLAMIGGAIGWKGVLFTIFAGSLVGTLAGIIIMVCNRMGDIKLKIPFGPFLSLGALLYIFWGTPLIDWYFGIIT